MAYLQLNYPSIWSETQHYIGLNKCNSRWKRPAKKVKITNLRGPFGKERRVVEVVKYCSTSTSSSSSSANNLQVNRRDYFGSLLNEHGWNVRRMIETDEEMKKVARVQAEAFHEPVILFNDLFLEFFKAEVLSGLLYRLKNSPPDRYACLVAEPQMDSSGIDTDDVVGVVDVTVLRDEDVLQHLSEADEYLYVSGIAVLNNFRRQKVATALLKACDVLCDLWGLEYLVLRAYEDDWGAQKLYSNAGYRVVSGDPAWMTSWIGRRRRVLMIKQRDNT